MLATERELLGVFFAIRIRETDALAFKPHLFLSIDPPLDTQASLDHCEVLRVDVGGRSARRELEGGGRRVDPGGDRTNVPPLLEQAAGGSWLERLRSAVPVHG